jgi:hypothetical protein
MFRRLPPHPFVTELWMIRRTLVLTAFPALLLAGSLARAGEISPFDAYYKAKAIPAAIPAGGARDGVVASIDPQRGTPSFFWAQRGAPLPATLSGAGFERLARHHLAAHAARWGLTPEALASAKPVLLHDTGRGGVIVVFRQSLGGVELLHSDMKVLTTRSGELVAISGGLHPAAVSAAQNKLGAFSLGYAGAVASALGDALGVKVLPGQLVDIKRPKAGYEKLALTAPIKVGADSIVLEAPARIKKVYYPMPNTLVPAYYVEVQPGKRGVPDGDMVAYVIAANDGRILMRRDLTAADAFQYRVWADPAGQKLYSDGPLQDFNPHPTGVPDHSISSFAAPVLVSMESFNTPPGGAVDPWLPVGATESKGNNVDAYTDQTDCVPTQNTPCTQAITDALDGFTPGVDIRATVTSPGVFDRTYDLTLGPLASQNQSMAAIQQLFYTTNYLHDYWYDSGFNETAGNAQDSNYGRGGVEGDHLRAEAQDKALGPPASRNNANMSTPADGESPRMQMFLWSGQNDLNLDIGAPINAAYPTGGAAFGPQNFDINGSLVLADDGVASVTNACEAITNDVTGKIVLVDRGTCTFVVKTARVQAAGGIGVILANNAANQAPPGLGGADASLTIPTLSVTLENGNALKAALAGGASIPVHMKRVSGVEHDGTIDNNVISHEWGHYLHHRLVDCGLLQCSGQSEGWADFVAMHQSIRQGDNVATSTWAMAQYATVSNDDEGYYGIRRLPYTRDQTKNPFTFKHISEENKLPVIPMGSGGADNFEVHNTGEIWTQMLVDAYSGLILTGGHTFDEAKRRMADYVVAGMILAPAEPTFTEQRDGILAAATAADPADMLILANNFAGRGAGSCAVSPPKDTEDNNGVVESYEIKGQHAIVKVKVDDSTKSCDSDGILDGGEAGKLTIEITNAGPVALTNTKVTVLTSTAGVVFPGGDQFTIASLAPFETKQTKLDIALSDAVSSKLDHIALTVKAENAGSCLATKTLDLNHRANVDDLVAASTIDTVDSEKPTWTLDGDLSDKIWSRLQADDGNYYWHGVDFGSKTLTSLESADIQVAGNGSFVFTFDHRYSFESDTNPTTYFDGAVIEIRDVATQTWTDVSQFASPGYTGQITDTSKNPLGLRQGYVAESAGYPAMKPVTLNFGGAFAGKTVRLRFQIGTDAGAGAPGWDIDNIGVVFVNNTPFSTVVADATTCNGVPVASAGPDQTVTSGDLVQLDASGSVDPDNNPLTYTWKQDAGTAATLFASATSTPVFQAPVVAAPTLLTFAVQVSDGKGSSSDTVDVLVKPHPSMGTGGGGTGGAGGGTGGTGGMGGMGGGTTTSTTTTATTGAGGSGNGGSGGDDTIAAGGNCDCSVAGGASRPAAPALLTGLSALAAALLRRRRSAR